MTEATQNLVQSAKGPQGELAKAVSAALEALRSQAELVKKGIQALPAQNLEGKVGGVCAVCYLYQNPSFIASFQGSPHACDRKLGSTWEKGLPHLYT